jgi:hypothetical protein
MKAHLFKILTGSILFTGCNTGPQADSKKPNILFIVTDDLGWADLKYYGADLHETPNIDKLAARSAVFTMLQW